jgi:hypothetical protein
MRPTGGLNESKNYNYNPNPNPYNKIHSLVTDIICSQTGVCCIR